MGFEVLRGRMPSETIFDDVRYLAYLYIYVANTKNGTRLLAFLFNCDEYNRVSADRDDRHDHYSNQGVANASFAKLYTNGEQCSMDRCVIAICESYMCLLNYILSSSSLPETNSTSQVDLLVSHAVRVNFRLDRPLDSAACFHCITRNFKSDYFLTPAPACLSLPIGSLECVLIAGTTKYVQREIIFQTATTKL